MLSYFEISLPNPPPPSDGVRWGLHFLLLFSAVHEISRTFEILTPNPLGWSGSNFLSIFWTVHIPDFCFFDPTKIPTSTPLGWRGQFFSKEPIPRSIRICVPNLVMIGPAVWPTILDPYKHTHTDRICNI